MPDEPFHHVLIMSFDVHVDTKKKSIELIIITDKKHTEAYDFVEMTHPHLFYKIGPPANYWSRYHLVTVQLKDLQ